MTGKVAIVTDTIGCISKEEIKRYHICEVPVRIIFEDKVYRDRFDLSTDEFYAMLDNSERLPTTTAPSPEHFFETFERVSKEADQVLCITLSSKLSSTHNSALTAAGMAKQRLSGTTIEVLDVPISRE